MCAKLKPARRLRCWDARAWNMYKENKAPVLFGDNKQKVAQWVRWVREGGEESILGGWEVDRWE